MRITPYDHLYPSLELSQARRQRDAEAGGSGDGSGLVAVRVRARHAAERVAVTVEADGLAQPARVEATLATAGRDFVLRPPLAWDAGALRSSEAPRPLRLLFRLQRDGVEAGTRTVDASLRPLSEALYFVRDGRDSVDLSWIFAAYVDERDAVVDRVLDAAGGSGIVERFDGYAGGSDAVYRQVWAVWHALSGHGIRYSPDDPGIARGPRVFSQRVRLLEQTWNDRSANCIDGSVLIASVLQRIGIDSFLVLVPGHAFVGFHLDAAHTAAAYLETTVLGAPAPALARRPRFADGVAGDGGLRDLDGVVAALALGRTRHDRVASRFDRAHRPDYALIDIAAARAYGIRPIEAAMRGAASGVVTSGAAPETSGTAGF